MKTILKFFEKLRRLWCANLHLLLDKWFLFKEEIEYITKAIII